MTLLARVTLHDGNAVRYLDVDYDPGADTVQLHDIKDGSGGTSLPPVPRDLIVQLWRDALWRLEANEPEAEQLVLFEKGAA